MNTKDQLRQQNRSLIKKGFNTNVSKVCKYRIINGKSKHRTIQVIKTYYNMLDQSKVRKLPRCCSFKQIYADGQNSKNKEQVLDTLSHYACTLIRPEFDRLFIEQSNQYVQIKKQSQLNTFNNVPQDQKSETSLTEFNRHFVTSMSSNSVSTKNLFQKHNQKKSILNMLQQKEKYPVPENKKQTQQQYYFNDEFMISKDNYTQISKERSFKIEQECINVNHNSFLKKDKTNHNEEAVSIYERIYPVIQDIGNTLAQIICQYDFNSFQLKTKPESEKYFTASIINIFQSFTKKHRAPYKMNSKEQTKKQLPAQSPSSNSEPFNQINESQNLYINTEDNQQIEDQSAIVDILIDDISSPSNLNINERKQLKKKSIKQSKFHNLKKSFMHALILLFQQDILNCLEIPENHGYFLQQIVNRMRIFSTKTRSGNGQYEYYSHTHYTALLLKLNEFSLPLIKQNPLDLQLHQAMYQEDLTQSIATDAASIKCNFYKSLIFKIIELSINIIEKQNHLLSNLECEKKSVCRFDYILRVKSGIEKLSQGIQVTRF